MPPQKTMISRSPNVSRSSRLPSIVPSIAAAYFWLVVVSKIIDRGRRKPQCIFYYLFFHRSIRRPKRLDGMPSRALLPTRFRYIIPSNTATDFGLIVV